MILVFTIGYITIIYLAFKTIKIRFGPIAVPAAALIGIFLMAVTTVCWKMSAPISDQAFVRRPILIMSPDVVATVSKVLVQSNDLVEKGDPLFEIKPDRFQDALDQASAELEAAQSTVSQLQADVTAAEATVKQEAAETASAKAQLDTALSLSKADAAAIAKLKLEETQQAYRADQAEDKLIEAQLKQARFSLASAEKLVDVAQAAFDVANFNRENCTYKSTVDGQVINLQITEGTPTARYRFTSIGTIQDLSETAIIAIFPQNVLKNVQAGDAAEIAFKGQPGKIASGKVDLIANYTGEGQFMSSLLVPVVADIDSEGYLAVRIRLDDVDAARDLPLGAEGAVAIYTDSGKVFHPFSKIDLRLKSWMNYSPF